MSIRLIDYCSKPGWKNIRDVLDMLPGPSFEEYQSGPPQIKKQRSPNEIKRTLVVFVGGCTYAEISALRFLSQQDDASTEYLVATTSVINGNSLIEGLMSSIQDPMAF